MIIKTDLTDRHNPRIFRELAQRRDHILWCFVRVSRMNSDHGENVRILFSKLDRAPAAFDRSADCNDACHARFRRTSQHIIKVGREIGIIEMRVCFDEHSPVKNVSRFRAYELSQEEQYNEDRRAMDQAWNRARPIGPILARPGPRRPPVARRLYQYRLTKRMNTRHCNE